MIARVLDRLPLHSVAASLCAGLAAANAIRATGPLAPVLCLALLVLAVGSAPLPRIVLACSAAALAGLSWGALRLEAIDQSPMAREIGRAGRALVEVTATPRRGRFDIRAQGAILRFERRRVREPVLLELPVGRSPPLGARLEVLTEVKAPRPRSNGFDEAGYLRRHGIHVVLKVDRWRTVGRRGGLGGLADRLHGGMTAALSSGSTGERRSVLAGIVLGDDGGVSQRLRDRFWASGLYHLLSLEEKTITR